MSPSNFILRLRRLDAPTALTRRLCRSWRGRSCASPLPRTDEPAPLREGPFVGWFDSSHDLLHGLAVTEHGDDLVLL